jgi:hypothetical protein
MIKRSNKYNTVRCEGYEHILCTLCSAHVPSRDSTGLF